MTEITIEQTHFLASLPDQRVDIISIGGKAIRVKWMKENSLQDRIFEPITDVDIKEIFYDVATKLEKVMR